MTREQAINYLISRGITEYRVSEIVRALTYEPTTKNNLGVEEVTALAEWTERLTKASVEAIPKADYENRLKADLKAILVELQLEIKEEAFDMTGLVYIPNTDSANVVLMDDLNKLIQQKINSLKEA